MEWTSRGTNFMLNSNNIKPGDKVFLKSVEPNNKGARYVVRVERFDDGIYATAYAVIDNKTNKPYYMTYGGLFPRTTYVRLALQKKHRQIKI